MATTFTKIASVSVGLLGASTIDFTSIPSTYTDLCLKVSTRDSRATAYRDLGLSFNGATANRSARLLYGDGSTAASYTVTNGYVAFNNSSTSTSNTFANIEFYIPNYRSSNFKSFSVDSVTENNATIALANFSAGLWSDTAAITQITLTPETSPLLQYSTAVLYGISKS
jgi:hypothetical protein